MVALEILKMHFLPHLLSNNFLTAVEKKKRQLGICDYWLECWEDPGFSLLHLVAFDCQSCMFFCPWKGTFVASIMLCQDSMRQKKGEIYSFTAFKQSRAVEFICLGLALSRRWHESRSLLLLLEIDAANGVIKTSKTRVSVWGKSSFCFSLQKRSFWGDNCRLF